MAKAISRQRAAVTASNEIAFDVLRSIVGGTGTSRSELIDPQFIAEPDADASGAPAAKPQDKAEAGTAETSHDSLYKEAFEMTHHKSKMLKHVLQTKDAAVTLTKEQGDITRTFSGTHFEDRIAKAKQDLFKASADVAKKQDNFNAADTNRSKALEEARQTAKAYSETRQTAKLIDEASLRQLQAARQDVDHNTKLDEAARQRFEASKLGLDKLKDDLRAPGTDGKSTVKDLKPAIDQFRVDKAGLERTSGDLDRAHRALEETKRATQDAKSAAEAPKSAAKDVRDTALGKLVDANKVKADARDELGKAKDHEQQQAKNVEKAKENVKTQQELKAEQKSKSMDDKLRGYGNKLYDKLAEKAVTAVDKKVKAAARTDGTYEYNEDVHHFTDPVRVHERIVDGNTTVEKTRLSETAYRESQEDYTSGLGRGSETKMSIGHLRYDETKTTVDHGNGTKTTTIDRSGFYAGAEGQAGYKANVAGVKGGVEDKLVLDWTDETIEIEDSGKSRQIDTEGCNLHSETGVKIEGQINANGASGEMKIYTDNTSTTYKERSYENSDGSTTTVGGKVFSTAGGYAGAEGDIKLNPLDDSVKASGKIGMEGYAGIGAGGSWSHFTSSGNGIGLSTEVSVGKVGGKGDFDATYQDERLSLKIGGGGGSGIIGGKGVLEIKGDVGQGKEFARSGTFFDYSQKEKEDRARTANEPKGVLGQLQQFNKYSSEPATALGHQGESYTYGTNGGVVAPRIDAPPAQALPVVKNPEPSFTQKLLNTALIQPKFLLGLFK